MSQNLASDPTVTPEDQTRINQFARLHTRLEEIRGDCKTKTSHIQNMNDAADEIILLDDDVSIPMRVGDSFVHMTADEATATMESMKEEMEKTVKAMKGEEDDIQAKLTKLKAELYAKFGDSINLDNSEA